MKASALSVLRVAMLLMVLVIFIVPPQFIIVAVIVQIGLVVASQFLRQRPRMESPLSHVTKVGDTYTPLCVDCSHALARHAAMEGSCLDCVCAGWRPPYYDTGPIHPR